MNRRGFISLLAGAAGAPLVPWRGLIEPLIVLPPRPKLITATGGAPPYAYHWRWEHDPSGLVVIDEPNRPGTTFSVLDGIREHHGRRGLHDHRLAGS